MFENPFEVVKLVHVFPLCCPNSLQRKALDMLPLWLKFMLMLTHVRSFFCRNFM